MNLAASGLDGCAVYLDDVVVYSNTWEEHIHHIHLLFNHLRNVHLTINLAKQKFANATVTCLGKVVGQEWLVLAKVAAIEPYPVPTT